jgi:hypothetical protein
VATNGPRLLNGIPTPSDLLVETVGGMREARPMETQVAPHANDSGIQPISLKQPYMLAFLGEGEDENGILRWWTNKILEAFAARGLSHKLVVLRDPAWCEDLTACLSIGKPEFCFSFQGMGMALPLPSGGNLP